MFKKTSIFLGNLITFLGVCFFAYTARAASTSDLLNALGRTAGFNFGGTTDQDTLIIAIAKIINIFLGLLGIIFIVLIIYGGFLWMTAGGREEQVGTAKKIITRSVIGAGIVILSYLLTWFVFEKLISVSNL